MGGEGIVSSDCVMEGSAMVLIRYEGDSAVMEVVLEGDVHGAEAGKEGFALDGDVEVHSVQHRQQRHYVAVGD
jgi:hypothetical protein